MPGTSPRRVLIVGAGTGHRRRARPVPRAPRHVDAVEIDPRIQQIGAQRQPRPAYHDPRVHRTSTTAARSWNSTDRNTT